MPNTALLPAGLHDLLPPDAEAQAASVDRMLEVFATYGYERVAPPLLEFEEGLLGGSGQAVADQTFRVMDPDSHRMMGVRADITPQVARIATTRLAAEPRPLRLCYAGPCLRVAGHKLSPDRQISQVGLELIGTEGVAGDAELVAVAAEALAAIGLRRVSFDLTLPRLLPSILDQGSLAPADRLAVARALDRKDAAAVRAHGGALAGTLHALLLAAGRPARALAALAAADLPPAARLLAARLAETVTAVEAASPGLALTVDPVESRGFRYHTGVCLTVFAPGRHEELGRGGRFASGADPATGLTLYADAVLRAAVPRPRRRRAYAPHGTDPQTARAWRDKGWAVVQALAPDGDATAEARRLNCHCLLRADGGLDELGEAG